MAKINNTSTFPIVAANDVANGDLLIGTDVSDTTNDAAGETKNFRVGDIRGGMTLITSASVSTSSAVVDITNFVDTSVYNSYFLYYDNLTVSGSGTSESVRLQGSNDGFSTTEFSGNLCLSLQGADAAAPRTGFGYVQLGNIGLSIIRITGFYSSYTTSTGEVATSAEVTITAPLNATSVDALRISPSTGGVDILSVNYYLYGLRNT